jgi:hypothetical protein
MIELAALVWLLGVAGPMFAIGLLVFGVIGAALWLLGALASLWPDKAARAKWRRNWQRERLLASLPRTKGGQLFPAGKRALAKFDAQP